MSMMGEAMPPGLMMPTGAMPAMPSMEEQRRMAAVTLAINSYSTQSNATNDDSLIRRAERIEKFLAGP